MVELALRRKRPNLSKRGDSLALYRGWNAQHRPASRVCGLLGGTRDGTLSDPKNVITKLHVNLDHASAQQMKRVLVDSDCRNLHLLRHIDGVLEHCEICRALGRAPHVPIAGTSTVFLVYGELQFDLLHLDEIIVLRARDVVSMYSRLTPGRSEIPQEVCDVVSRLRVVIFGSPKGLRTDERGRMEERCLGRLLFGAPN